MTIKFDELMAVAENTFDEGNAFYHVTRAISLCMEARLVHQHTDCSLTEAIALLSLAYKLEPEE